MRIVDTIKSIFMPNETLEKVITCGNNKIKIYGCPFYQRLEVNGNQEYFSEITEITGNEEKVTITGVIYQSNQQVIMYNEDLMKRITISKDGQIEEEVYL